MAAGGEPRPCGACLFFGIGHSNRILDGLMDPTQGSGVRAPTRPLACSRWAILLIRGGRAFTPSRKFLVAFQVCESGFPVVLASNETVDGRMRTAVSRRSTAVRGLSPAKVIPRGRPKASGPRSVARQDNMSSVNSQ